MTSPYYIEYTVDTSKTYALNEGDETHLYGLPRIYGTEVSYTFNYENIEITLLDGTITTDVSTTCDQVAKVKLWYPESTAAIKFQGSETFSPAVKTVDYCKTDNFTIMDYMFYYCKSLTSLNTNSWNTSKVTDMDKMFYYCPKITSLDLNDWDTSSVTNMSYMFYYCPKLTSLNISNWDTGQVATMNRMFYNCQLLKSLDLNDWDTSKVVNMSMMFNYCKNLTSLNISNWDVSKVMVMDKIFRTCSSLTELDLRNWDINQEANIGYMFENSQALSKILCKQNVLSKIQNELLERSIDDPGSIMCKDLSDSYDLSILQSKNWNCYVMTNKKVTVRSNSKKIKSRSKNKKITIRTTSYDK
jgi:surface protein